MKQTVIALKIENEDYEMWYFGGKELINEEKIKEIAAKHGIFELVNVRYEQYEYISENKIFSKEELEEMYGYDEKDLREECRKRGCNCRLVEAGIIQIYVDEELHNDKLEVLQYA